MSTVLVRIRGWFADKLGLLLVIIALLFFTSWIVDEYQRTEPLRIEIQVVEQAVGALQKELADVDAKIRPFELKWREYLDRDKQAKEAKTRADECQAELDDLAWWYRYRHPGDYGVKKAQCETLAAIAAGLEKDLDALSRTAEMAVYRGRIERKSEIERQIQATTDLRDELRRRLDQGPLWRMMGAVVSKVPTALAILVAVLIAPVIIKVIFFFVLAPQASRLPPIRIIPDDTMPEIPGLVTSSVSVSIDVPPGEELLVQSDFLQSSSQPAKKRTQWFLNAALPFSSLASGMFALTRIRPEGASSTRVVVSSQEDAFGEVGVIEIPDGAAMVVQPRSMAGIVKSTAKPVVISRHWRLRSLHAWLTLQLRYLVFHGPCRLILKGCRGVRCEVPDPQQPRLIRQASTLGFSANLEYQTTRSETFIPYLLGKEDLFNDLFAGGRGRFVYEEMPAGRKGGALGRGMEGLFDALLKAFGI